MDIDANVQEFLAGRNPDGRDASFDYCFNYFQSFRESGIVPDLSNGQNVQLSALHLGFYLASWGMLRGSTQLFQQSVRYLIPVIDAIAHTDASFWQIDADCYTVANIQTVVQVAERIRSALPSMTDTLLTKIMLGVFGNVPAFDDNFTEACGSEGGVQTFGVGALQQIGSFYHAHAAVIDAHRVPTFDFTSGRHTQRPYTRAKVIDMAFYVEGEKLVRAKPPVGQKKLLRQAAVLGGGSLSS